MSHSQQTWEADDYAQNARFVADLAGDVFAWLDPKPGERILDLGCGDGHLTHKITKTGAEVVGVDGSENMIEASRKLGLDAHVMDGHALEFEEEFDAVFSNAALHWMLEPEEVIKGVKRALKPGGRFAAEFGGSGNVAAVVTAMHGVAAKRGGNPALASQWFFPSPPEYQQMLEEHGFEVVRIGLYPRPTPLPTGMRAWIKTMCTPFFAQFGDDMEKAIDDALELLSPALQDWQGDWHADYVRLRVEARLP